MQGYPHHSYDYFQNLSNHPGPLEDRQLWLVRQFQASIEAWRVPQRQSRLGPLHREGGHRPHCSAVKEEEPEEAVAAAISPAAGRRRRLSCSVAFEL